MEDKYAIWLSLCESIGNVRAKLLVDYFGSAEVIYNANKRELKEIEGISPKMINNLMNKDLTRAEEITAACKRAGCSIISITDNDYPERLKNIFNPPTVMYIKGKLPQIDNFPVVGIVGTRWCTPYGYQHAENLGRELSKKGIIVSTGLAKGIDTAAATGGLCGDMPVIGVIGCGIDKVYPVSNKKLFGKVAETGAIVSEYPPGTVARPEFFPQRNRIISGLSNGVVVIEAPERSGALITAQYANEQNRDVFVLPGNVDARACIGSNRLLRDGAIPYISPEDIIEEYKDFFHFGKKSFDNNNTLDYIDVGKTADIFNKLDENEKILAESIRDKALYIDEIIDITGIPTHTALSALTTLELIGLAGRDDNGRWELL